VAGLEPDLLGLSWTSVLGGSVWVAPDSPLLFVSAAGPLMTRKRPVGLASGESRILGQGMLLKKFHTQFRKSTFQFGNKVVIRFKIMD
jgi:hypothetical protein